MLCKISVQLILAVLPSSFAVANKKTILRGNMFAAKRCSKKTLQKTVMLVSFQIKALLMCCNKPLPLDFKGNLLVKQSPPINMSYI